MAIQIQNSETLPALVYDKFFLEELRLTQRISGDDTKPPYYTLKISFRIYAVDDNNVRHYKNKVDSVEINDYAAVAYAKALAGDNDLATAAVAIENALVAIIQDQKPEFGGATVI
jgi:hypothetical protein